jgi:hypothetical protein
MRLSKFITLVVSVTFVALLYVYQQTEIFRLAYVGQKKSVSFQDLLDKNNALRYNIETKASLVEVGSKITGSSDFQMPDSYRLVRLAPAKATSRAKQLSMKKESLASRIFSVKREAEANTLSP